MKYEKITLHLVDGVMVEEGGTVGTLVAKRMEFNHFLSKRSGIQYSSFKRIHILQKVEKGSLLENIFRKLDETPATITLKYLCHFNDSIHSSLLILNKLHSFHNFLSSTCESRRWGKVIGCCKISAQCAALICTISK